MLRAARVLNAVQSTMCMCSAIAGCAALTGSWLCRDDRKYSRLKYLVHDWGMDKFRSVVQQYLGKAMEPFRYCPVKLHIRMGPELRLS